MREIKFRAWDPINQRLLYPGFNPLDLPAWPTVGHILMQYTGLNDKNGKEIYEGDICRYYLGDSNSIGEMECPDLCCGCWLKKGNMRWSLTNEANGLMEVIGNIYENPEMLKAKP